MALAVDVVDRRGPSNQMHLTFYLPFIANKTKRLFLKVGVSYRYKLAKCVTSYSQRRLVLSVYIAAKDVLPTLHCTQDGAH